MKQKRKKGDTWDGHFDNFLKQKLFTATGTPSRVDLRFEFLFFFLRG
jgi:hypothetical protein